MFTTNAPRVFQVEMRRNDRFHVVSTWNTHFVFAGLINLQLKGLVQACYDSVNLKVIVDLHVPWLFNHIGQSNCCFIQTKLLTNFFYKKA